MVGQPTGDLEAHRRRLFGIAYRMLGQVSEAEDVVQEAFLRYLEYGPERIADTSAFLVTVATRISIDRLKAARAKREHYFGTWLPEPIISGSETSSEAAALQRESLSMAMLVLLERLSPAERAVFVLREAFGYDYSEIGRILCKSESNCRVLLHRAKQRLQRKKPRFEVSYEERERLLGVFLAAAHSGDVARLASVLHRDVEFLTDGGGKVPAMARPAVGREKVAAAISLFMKRFGEQIQGMVAEVNAEPALLLLSERGLVLVAAVEFEGRLISAMRLIVNPEKLAYAARQLGLKVTPVTR